MNRYAKPLLALALCLGAPVTALFAGFHYDNVYSSLSLGGGSNYRAGSVAAPAGSEVYYSMNATAYSGASASANVNAGGAVFISASVSGWQSDSDAFFLSSPGTVYYNISASSSGYGQAYASAEFVVAW